MELAKTKSEWIKEFAKDELANNTQIEAHAEEIGITVKEFAKSIAEIEFNTRLQEGSLVKVGRRYKLV